MSRFQAMASERSSEAGLEAQLVALRRFLSTCPPRLRGARLVRYRGLDLVGSVDVMLGDLETQVAGCLREGFGVDWLYRSGLLYLRACESAGPPPSWQRLFAQQDLEEMKSRLRDDGFE